ncbi:hypothetical protein ACQ4PT_012549 [Festuca glaucescens]
MASGSTLLLWLLLSLPSVAISTTSNRGIRLELTHADTRGDFTGTERIRRAAERSHRRVNGLLDTGISSTATLKGDGIEGTASVHASTATYLVDLAIGTPPLPMTAVLDTGSDLIWTQCDAPCRKCFPQPAPLYAPARSATYANVSCRSTLCDALRVDPSSRCSVPERGWPYYFSYGDGTSTDGVLATETLTFESGATVHGIAFGCGTENHGSTDNSSGVVGMGRGPLSLVSQLGVTRFSYCFTPFKDKTASPLFLGPSSAALSTTAMSTPFAPNPSGGGRRSSYYYLNLEGISVGETLLPIDPVVFQVSPMGGGGFIIDSGTTLIHGAGGARVRGAGPRRRGTGGAPAGQRRAPRAQPLLRRAGGEDRGRGRAAPGVPLGRRGHGVPEGELRGGGPERRRGVPWDGEHAGDVGVGQPAAAEHARPV